MTVKLLLLEDDMELSDTIKQFLECKGYTVYTAYDGLEAEALCYESNIDLMLLDVRVPHVSGFDFLKKIRAEGKETPAIFITSLNAVEDVEKGFSLGCDDYIRKPFALKELLVRVESLLKRSFGTHQEMIEIGQNYYFNIKALVLSHGEEKIPLKMKELKLLAFFLQHTNVLLDYENINKAVWEYDEVPSAGSLRTYIKTLRAIIGKDKIETVKNIGYRYVS